MGSKLKTWSRLFAKVIAALVLLSVLWVILLNWIHPPFTYLMLSRKVAALFDKKSSKVHYTWRRIENISPHLAIAVIAAEDQNFNAHFGFDTKAIRKAIEKNKKGKRKAGASTISQQVAKNVFLWPGRSWLRKGCEAYFTILIELFWPKERILEVYLNVIEMGPMIFGAEAAANIYFGKPASKLTMFQSALIAAVLPNPIRFSVTRPSGYVLNRRNWIMRQCDQLGGRVYLDDLR